MPNANSHSENSTELILRIKSFFVSNQYPGDQKIVAGIFPPVMPEAIEIFSIYQGKKWESIDDEALMSNGAMQSSIGFLTPDSFFYFLPAFLIHIFGDQYSWSSACLLDDIEERLNKDKIAKSFYGNNEYLSIMTLKFNRIQLDLIETFFIYVDSHPEKYPS